MLNLILGNKWYSFENGFRIKLKLKIIKLLANQISWTRNYLSSGLASNLFALTLHFNGYEVNVSHFV